MQETRCGRGPNQGDTMRSLKDKMRPDCSRLKKKKQREKSQNLISACTPYSGRQYCNNETLFIFLLYLTCIESFFLQPFATREILTDCHKSGKNVD